MAKSHSELPLSSSESHRRIEPQYARRGAIVGIVLLGLGIYLPGIHWGLPATVSWSQDTIAGVRTLGAVEEWPAAWRGRYPPLHYFILRAAYEPILRHWDRTGERVRDDSTRPPRLTQPHAPKVGLLILVARLITVAMAVGAGLAVWSAALRRTGDWIAAAASAVALMIGASFTYFAHLGNVDVPAMFWFAVSLLFYVRLLESRRLSDALWLGFFGSLAISTKDSTAGVYPGMAVVLLIAELRRGDPAEWLGRAFVRAILQWRWVVGVAAFTIPYLLINGVFWYADPYITRMKYWLGITPDTIHLRQAHSPSIVHLTIDTMCYAGGAVGWPMLIVMALSTVYAVARRRNLAWTMLAPAASYYLIIIVPQGFVYSRFLFPVLAVMGMLVGAAVADGLRNRRVPIGIRAAAGVAPLLLSLGYTAAVDLEMCNDSRYAAESWIHRSVDPDASIGAFADPQYLPRLGDAGYATYRVPMQRAAFDRPQPDYLLLTSYNYEDFDDAQRRCMRDLLAGRLGYVTVASFAGRFLPNRSCWLGVAGWGAPTPGKISPTITILRRLEPATGS